MGRSARRSLRGCGRGAVDWNMAMRFDGFVKDTKGFIEKVCCTAHGHMNLLKSLLPPALLMEGVKTAMMLIQNRLLRIEDETIN